jgi:hypothetical protein
MNDGLVSLREASTPHAAQRREALQTQAQGALAVRGGELRGTAQRGTKQSHATTKSFPKNESRKKGSTAAPSSRPLA